MVELTDALNRKFGRRSFVKGASAALGLVAAGSVGTFASGHLQEAHASQHSSEEEIFQGVCRGNCGGGCRMNVHVREGKVVKTSRIEAEDDLDTRLCQRGLSHAQRIYSPERVQYPMRRAEGTERGAGEWERITWEEAIDEIATKWKGYIEEFGGTSIGMNFGAGTYAYNQYVYQHLFYQFGGTNYDSGYDMASLNVGKVMLGRGIYLHGNHHSDARDAKVLFCWGSNSTVAQVTRMSYINAAIANGAKVVVINPLFTDMAEKADIWVPIKPGTDGALALAMLKYIFDNGLQSDSYLRKRTVAPYLVKEDHSYLRMSDLGVAPVEGPVNASTGKPALVDPIVVCSPEGDFGSEDEVANPVIHGSFEVGGFRVTTALDLLIEHVQDWTPEKAAAYCEIDESLVSELAELYVEGPTTLEIGFGLDHRSNGASATMCILCLPMVTGQMGKQGAGIGGTMGQSTMGTHCVNFLSGMMPKKIVPMTSVAIADFPEIMRTGEYGSKPMTPKSLITFCGNTVSNISGREKLMEAAKGLELIVCCETWMTDTARYSDIILPVAHWFEYETFITCPTPWALFQDKCVPPSFECKTDVEICRLIADAMGLDSSAYQSDEVYNSLFLQGEQPAAWNLTWERLKREKSVLVCPIPFYFGAEDDPDFAFSTDTGRAQFYRENPRPWFDHGQEFDPEPWYLPSVLPTTEAYNSDNPLSAKYPINLVSQRDRLKVHTQFAKHPWFLEIQPEPALFLNKEDADARGLEDGDYARVYNDRGHVVLKVYLDAGMRPGMARAEHTWWDDQYVDGSYPSLLPLETSEAFPAVHPYDTLVEIEKTTVKG